MNNSTPVESWREGVMSASLRGFGYAENTAALIREIRRHLPTCSTLTLSCDRRRVMEFLRAQTSELERMLAGDNRRLIYRDEIDHWDYIGWYSANWNGSKIEIALPPSEYMGGDVVLVGESGDLLDRFSEALIAFLEKPKQRALQYAQGWEEAPELNEQISRVKWEDITLAPAQMKSVCEAIEGFFAHKAAFEALGFAWRRGVLLIGPPGTGKTMICKAAAASLPDLPFLYVRDLREHEQQEAIKMIFDRARKLAPCILAFEDVDGLVSDYNRTVFLNEMDGFHSNDGLLVIASSNHPGKIDEALLKRPSRFDRVFHIGLPAEAERAEYSRRLLSRSSLASHLADGFDIENLAVEVAAKSEGFTPAYLKEAFTAAALQRAQSGAMILNEEFASGVLAQIEELKAHLKRMKDPDALAEMRSGDDNIGFRR